MVRADYCSVHIENGGFNFLFYRFHEFQSVLGVLRLTTCVTLIPYSRGLVCIFVICLGRENAYTPLILILRSFSVMVFSAACQLRATRVRDYCFLEGFSGLDARGRCAKLGFGEDVAI